MNLNKVHLIGRVTADPEVKSIGSGTMVASFSLATNRVWKNNDGEKQEDTQFHNVVFFGKVTDVIEQYVSKGMLLYIEGRLQTRSWEDKDSGKKMYRTEIIGETIQLPPKSIGGGSDERTERPAKRTKTDEEFDAMGRDDTRAETETGKRGGKTKAKAEGDEDINIDDIPF